MANHISLFIKTQVDAELSICKEGTWAFPIVLLVVITLLRSIESSHHSTTFYRRGLNPSEKSTAYFVVASHTSSQTILALQPECGFPPVVSHLFMLKSFFKWGPPCSIGYVPTLLQLPMSTFFALLHGGLTGPFFPQSPLPGDSHVCFLPCQPN